MRRLSFRLDEDARRISELRLKIELLEKERGRKRAGDSAAWKEELEAAWSEYPGTLLVGTQMFSQLQQHQCIAEATAKEQQCLVDYFAQLRFKARQGGSASTASPPRGIFLIMRDDLHYDDEAIAAALNVKRTSVRSMCARKGSKEESRVALFASNVISLQRVTYGCGPPLWYSRRTPEERL